MRTKAYQEKRQAIFGKSVLGIDPGKQKYAGAILDASGVQQGNTFRFEVSREGFDQILWKQVNKRIDATRPEDIVVAIETSCNLWMELGAVAEFDLRNNSGKWTTESRGNL